MTPRRSIQAPLPTRERGLPFSGVRSDGGGTGRHRPCGTRKIGVDGPTGGSPDGDGLLRPNASARLQVRASGWHLQKTMRCARHGRSLP
ncbi:hypothetical protein [Azospirillum argentinense]